MKNLYCIECGERVKEDDSPGVYLHDSEDQSKGDELDDDHVANPEQDGEYDLGMGAMHSRWKTT